VENNNQLITINYNGENQTVLGRELHDFLEVKTQYKDWFPRMCEYGFVENEDFNLLKNEQVQIEGNRSVSRVITDHQMTVEMAKEISMIQRSDKGKLARQYFIELEKKWNSPEAIMARALTMANKTIDNLKLHTSLLEAKIEEQAPKVELADRLFICDAEVNIGEVAKLFNEKIRKGKSIGRDRLFEILREEHVLMTYGAEKNNPQQKYIDNGCMVLKTSTFDNGHGKTKLSSTTKVTPKGINWLWNFLIKKGYIMIDDVLVNGDED